MKWLCYLSDRTPFDDVADKKQIKKNFRKILCSFLVVTWVTFRITITNMIKKTQKNSSTGHFTRQPWNKADSAERWLCALHKSAFFFGNSWELNKTALPCPLCISVYAALNSVTVCTMIVWLGIIHQNTLFLATYKRGVELYPFQTKPRKCINT